MRRWRLWRKIYHDVAYLRQLHLSGFELFYGVGLPRQPLIFVNSGRGFVLADGPEAVGVKSLPSKDVENLYFRLLWRRFGHAVSLIGVVKESDPEQSLFCLKLDRDRETWCRLRSAGAGAMHGRRTRSCRLCLGKTGSPISWR